MNFLLKAVEVYVDLVRSDNGCHGGDSDGDGADDDVLQGKFTIAAKHHVEIAEIFEQEPVDKNQVRLINENMFIIAFFEICIYSHQLHII